MAILSKYLTDFVDSFSLAFQSGSNIQTTAVAIAITGSLCCSILLLILNLINAQSAAEQTKHGQAKLRTENRKDRPTVMRRHSVPHFRSSPVKQRCQLHSSSPFQNPTSHSSKKSATQLCPMCCVAKSEKMCQRNMCDMCCYGDRSWCCYHRNKPISIEESAPKEIDLSKQNLVQCPERIGYSGHQVETLTLSCNLLTCLPEEIGCLQGLSDVDLSHNRLQQLPECFGNLSHLKVLRLSHNQLSTLPDSCHRLQLLMELQLDHNNLITFPDSICKLQQLNTLTISHNRMESLPEDICNVQNLYILDIANNPVRALPQNIDSLIHLHDLRASSCYLTALPAALCSCVCLAALDVSHNKLHILPAALGRLHHLTDLKVNNNQLQYLPMSLHRALIHTDLRIFQGHNNSLINKEGKDEFLKQNSPTLESSSGESADIPCLPTLQEWCAKAIINEKIEWQNADLPVVLKDTLSRVRRCHQCQSPMFDFYLQNLDFISVRDHGSLPLYECVCTLHQGQNRHTTVTL